MPGRAPARRHTGRWRKPSGQQTGEPGTPPRQRTAPTSRSLLSSTRWPTGQLTPEPARPPPTRSRPRPASARTPPAGPPGCSAPSRSCYDLGDLERTQHLLGDLDAGALDQGERVRLAWLREIFTEDAWSGAERVASFTSIAQRMGDAGDTRRAVEMLVGIALRCWWSNLDPGTRIAVAEVADGLRSGPDDPAHLVVTAMAAPLERGRDALAAFGRVAVPDLYPDAGLLLTLGLAGTAVGDQPRAITMLSAAIAESRRQGTTGVLTQALISLAWAETHLGRLARADVAAEEGVRLARETGQPLWRATGQLAYAASRGLRGDAEASEALAGQAERVLLGSGANPMLVQVQAARGFAALGSGRYDDAFAQLSRAFTVTDAAYHQYFCTFLVAELAEAAAHCGRQDDARELLADIEPLAEQTGSPILHAGLLVARPLLADDGVEELYRAALADGLSAWPLQRARLLLGFGGVAAQAAPDRGGPGSAPDGPRDVRGAGCHAVGRARGPGAARHRGGPPRSVRLRPGNS